MPGRQGQGAQRLSSYITQEFTILGPYEENENPVTVLWVAKKVGSWLYDTASFLSKLHVCVYVCVCVCVRGGFEESKQPTGSERWLGNTIYLA